MLHLGKSGGNDQILVTVEDVCGNVNVFEISAAVLVAQGNGALYGSDPRCGQSDISEPVNHRIRMGICKKLSAEIQTQLRSVGFGKADQVIDFLQGLTTGAAGAPGKAGGGSGKQDQPGYAETVEAAHISQGNGASHGESHQSKSVQAELPDCLVDIGGHLVIGVSAGRRIRPAETSQIHRNHAVSEIREQVDLVFKDQMGQGPSVDEEDSLLSLWIIVVYGNPGAVV